MRFKASMEWYLSIGTGLNRFWKGQKHVEQSKVTNIYYTVSKTDKHVVKYFMIIEWSTQKG